VPKKYCVVSGIYPPDSGGPAKFASTFSQFLLDRNETVRVISYTNSKSHVIARGNEEINLVSRKLPIPLRYLRIIFLFLKSATRRELFIVNGCFVEIAILRIFLPFAYVTKIPGDIVWERARNNGLTTLNVDDFQSQELNLKYRFFRYMFSLSLRLSKKVIVPSIHLQKLAISWGVPNERISLVYNSIDTDRFIPALRINRKFDVLTVSRLVPWKGVEELIKVCSSLGLSLGIVGDGPLREKLETVSLESKALVTFFGDVDQDRLVTILQDASFFVLNSTFEGCPHALLEAMSCGLVPVSNDSTGSAEVIRNKVNGILCGSSTGFTLEAALRFLTLNPDLVSGMSENARLEIQSNFNFKVNYEKIRTLTDA
jgi:glycosyltransferase involved in cell wall biosynthesis